MQQAIDPRAAAGLDQLADQLDVHFLEAAPAAPALVQDPDQVDDSALPGAELGKLARIVDVGGDQLERRAGAEVAARAGSRVGTVMRQPARASAAHKCVPTNPDPPSTQTEPGVIARL